MRKYFFMGFVLLVLSSFSGKDVVWVAIGDSITYLNDHPDETAKRVKRGYLTRVAAQLSNVKYINQGHNGWKASDIAEKIDQLGLIKADVYTVFLGTNDWWAGRPLGTINDYKNATGTATTYGSFRVIINKLRLLNNQAKIVLITPMQRNDFVYVLDANNNAYGSYKTKSDQSLEAFANAVIAIGKLERIPVADLYHDKQLDITHAVNFKRLKDPQTGQYVNYNYPEFTTIPFNPKTDEYPYPPEAINITYDGLHPSDKGDSIIAAHIVKAFKNSRLKLR